MGIDLGTTNSRVAVWQDGGVVLIADDQGSRLIPSVVSFTDMGRNFGVFARDATTENTVFQAKRLLGRRISDETLQADVRRWPTKLVGGRADRPLVEITWRGEKKQFCAEEIVAMILTKLKEVAEAHLGQEVKKAVITVPISFNDLQRQVIKDAGIIAGLHVIRIVSETSATAFTYILKEKKPDHSVLILDLGGGFLSVSLMQFDEGFCEVKTVGGDMHLGGEHFTDRLVDFFAKAFEQRHKTDLTKNSRALRRLRAACETTKCTLSSETEASIAVEALAEGMDFSSSITRARFEELSDDLFCSMIDRVERVLRDAKMDKAKVDEILLVGGATRMPKVQQLLSEYFNGKPLNKSLREMEAVAYGAAVHAAIYISGQASGSLKDMILVDVTPISLGIETAGQQMTVLIPRNNTAPCKKSLVFSTSEDNQRVFSIKVYEGEHALVIHNNLLGVLELAGIPPAPRAVPKIEVTFDLDANGILIVSAEDKSTGQKTYMTIKNAGRLSEAEIKRMTEEADLQKELDAAYRRRMHAKNEIESYGYALRGALRNIERSLDEMTQWLETHPNVPEEAYVAQRQALATHVASLLPVRKRDRDTL